MLGAVSDSRHSSDIGTEVARLSGKSDGIKIRSLLGMRYSTLNLDSKEIRKSNTLVVYSGGLHICLRSLSCGGSHQNFNQTPELQQQ